MVRAMEAAALSPTSLTPARTGELYHLTLNVSPCLRRHTAMTADAHAPALLGCPHRPFVYGTDFNRFPGPIAQAIAAGFRATDTAAQSRNCDEEPSRQIPNWRSGSSAVPYFEKPVSPDQAFDPSAVAADSGGTTPATRTLSAAANAPSSQTPRTMLAAFPRMHPLPYTLMLAEKPTRMSQLGRLPLIP